VTTTLKFGGVRAYSGLALGELARPYVPIRIQNGGRHLDTVAKIDSGADSAWFNSALATQLGFVLDPAALKTATGIGSAQYWEFKVRITACGKRFEADAGFSSAWSRPYGLLGQLDFFRQFLIAFDKSQDKFYYHPV
jgi:hypothetical protein